MSHFKIPQTIKGAWIWTEVMPQYIPEINFENLLKLGTIIKYKDRVEIYISLRASLRKIQWTKFTGFKAIAIEQDIEKQKKSGTIILDPLGIIGHSLSVTDCLIHTKSALDSMAIFLTDFYKLKIKKPGERDLKYERFRRKIIEKDKVIGEAIKKLTPWFTDIQDLRDEWIHRTTVRDAILIGPTEVGILPIPKKAHVDMQIHPITTKNFWSTSDFVKYHYYQFVYLFNSVVERCIQIEVKDMDQIPDPDPNELGLAFFPTRVTENMTAERISMSNITLSGFYKRLSEYFKHAHDLIKIEGSHLDFLTNVAYGLWEYVCNHFGIPIELPDIRVIFVTEKTFNQLLNFYKFSKIVQERKATVLHTGSLDPEEKQDCHFIAIQKSKLKNEKKFFTRFFHQNHSISDTILRSLIHEAINLHWKIRGKKYVIHSEEPVTEDDIEIYNQFKKDHPEYFTKQSNTNLLKNLEKIQD